MIIRFEGRDWEYDEDAVTIQQAIAMQLAYGFTLADWHEATKKLDPRAWQCAYWLMLAQNGVIKTIKELDFAAVRFAEAVIVAKSAEDDAAAEPEPEPEPDPTSPATPAPTSPEPPTQTDGAAAPAEEAVPALSA